MAHVLNSQILESSSNEELKTLVASKLGQCTLVNLATLMYKWDTTQEEREALISEEFISQARQGLKARVSPKTLAIFMSFLVRTENVRLSTKVDLWDDLLAAFLEVGSCTLKDLSDFCHSLFRWPESLDAEGPILAQIGRLGMLNLEGPWDSFQIKYFLAAVDRLSATRDKTVAKIGLSFVVDYPSFLPPYCFKTIIRQAAVLKDATLRKFWPFVMEYVSQNYNKLTSYTCQDLYPLAARLQDEKLKDHLSDAGRIVYQAYWGQTHRDGEFLNVIHWCLIDKKGKLDAPDICMLLALAADFLEDLDQEIVGRLWNQLENIESLSSESMAYLSYMQYRFQEVYQEWLPLAETEHLSLTNRQARKLLKKPRKFMSQQWLGAHAKLTRLLVVGETEGFDDVATEVQYLNRFQGSTPSGVFGGIFIRFPFHRDELRMLVDFACRFAQESGRVYVYGYEEEGVSQMPKMPHLSEWTSWKTQENLVIQRARIKRVGQRPGSFVDFCINSYAFDVSKRKINGSSEMWSVPGLFAKGGLDVMSQLLIDSLKNRPWPAESILDFGCGNGQILKHVMPMAHAASTFTGVDADVLALSCCEYNFAQEIQNGRLKVYHSDILRGVPTQSWDLILANLPVHEGRIPSLRVCEAFLKAVHQSDRLRAGGSMLLVCQKRVPMGCLLSACGFPKISVFGRDSRFVVWKATR